MEEALADLKFMYAQVEGFKVDDKYDFLPHHDAPEIGFDEACGMYESE